MKRSKSTSRFSRMQPPLRRVLAIDAGSRRFKLLLAQSDFGRIRIVKEEEIDLQAEGLVSAEETTAHLQARLDEWGRPPLALVLPQHLSISQVIDLPEAPESEAAKLIEGETLKLGGVSESRIVYDFVRVQDPGPGRQRFWVTLCQEGDIREHIVKLGLEQEDLSEVTTAANALTTAYQDAAPNSKRAILIHVGAQTTVMVILLNGQPSFTASFQMGGDFFTRSLARVLQCPEEKAASLKQHTDFFQGPDASPEFITSVEGWVTELKQQLNEWFAENAALAAEAASFELIGSGGGLLQPGLLDYLRKVASLHLRPWPRKTQPHGPWPGEGFEIAFGTALQALGCSPHPVSLLPDEFREVWKKRLTRQKIEFASGVLLALCAFALAFGSWHKFNLVGKKQELLRKVLAGHETVTSNESLAEELGTDYEALRPVFAARQNTLDTLETLALLQASRSNRSFWYVALADQQSYFNAPLPAPSTNKPVRTNVSVSLPDRPPVAGSTTNLYQAKPGLIAELCVPEDAEAARQVLSQLVAELKKHNLFSKADLLSDDLHREVADPKVTLADRRFVLALDFAQTEFQQPSKVRPLSTDRSRIPGTRSRVRSEPVRDRGGIPK